METAGLAIAIPGLLALVAKSYLEINRAVEYYRNIDKNLFDTLNRLAAETDTSDSLIKLAQENATYLEDKNLYQAVVRYIECIRSIMGEVSTTLSELNRPPSKLNPIGKKAIPSVASALAVITICLSQKTDAVSTMRRLRLSHRRKLKLVFCNTPERLVGLLEDLNKQNNTFTLRLVSSHLFNDQTAQKAPILMDTAPNPIGSSVTGVVRDSEAEEDQKHEQQQQQLDRPQDSQKSQIPLPTMLYQTLAKKLQCRCHLLHLGLEIQRNIQTSSIARPDGSQRIEFSAFVTPSMYNIDPKSNDTNALSRMTCELYLEIVDTFANDTRPRSCCIDNLCEALFAKQQQDQVEYLLEDFLLRRVPQFKRTQSGNALSLHDLAEGKRRVTQYDRLKLAVKLGRAAVLLHSSPWISEWNSRTIMFFAQYEESKEPADWRPHISTILNPNYTPRPLNTDIHALGMILLEFGGVDMDKYRIWAPSSDTLEPALRTVMKQLGVPYMKVAERCFNVYKDSMIMDQSQQKNMDALRAEIRNLEKHVTECFEF